MTETVRVPSRLPMAVVVTLGLQTAGALMWASAADQRLGAVERRLEAEAAAPERLARVEEQVSAVRAQLQRIEDKLDQMVERGAHG